jgi:hypothetical protein
MQTETFITPTRTPSDVLSDAPSQDPLAEIDHLMEQLKGEEQRSAARSAQLLADRSDFSSQFTAICEQEIRPPMEAIVERLRRNGGGGLIEEGAEDASRRRDHRLTLWMSLHGEIDGSPREDRHPYLQLDANVNKRSVVISEGDMWQGHGGNRSGKVGEWWLTEITAALVTREALAILRRSVGQPAA